MKIISRLRGQPRVNVLRLSGVIGSGSRIGGKGLNDAALAPLIEKAFLGKPKAVALAINSPGGSPVQSALIAARIQRLSEEKSVPVLAFCEDVAASGGYWLATAADEIFADANSIVGSIGVISAGFGLDGLIARHGVTRRVYTAGESKSMADPFKPEEAEDIARIQELQSVIHENFKDQVRTRRGDKLRGEDLFTGRVWVGRQAQDAGLIDGIGHLVPMIKDRFGPKTRLNVLTARKPLLGGLGFGSMASNVADQVEASALWSRYGL